MGYGGVPGSDEAVIALMDASSQVVVAVDEAGRVTYLNPRAVEVLGWSPEDLVGRAVEELVPVEVAERHVRHRAVFSTEGGGARPMSIGLDLVVRRRDGSVFPAEISLTPLVVAEGAWTVASVTDITARKDSEREVLAMSRAFLTLAHVNQVIVRAEDASDLFEQICQVAVDQGGFLGAWVAVPGPGTSVDIVTSAGSLDGYVSRKVVTTDPDDEHGRGPTGIALREGRSYFSAHFLDDPLTRPWHGLGREFGLQAAATLPLRSDGRVVACLTLYSDRPDFYDDELERLLEGVADNVSFALDRLEARRRLEEVAAQRSRLLTRLVAAQEGERARIAADVHDDFVQSVAALGLRLGVLRRQANEAEPALGASFEELQELVTALGGGLRQLLLDLEPAEPGATLVEMLRSVAEQVLDSTPVRWSVERPADQAGTLPADGLSDAVVVQTVRIVKEALINVRKHARASTVAVVVAREADGVEITITDDGVGLAPGGPVSAPGHRGVDTMRDRAEIAGGWFRLGGADGSPGTEARLWVPVGQGEPAG